MQTKTRYVDFSPLVQAMGLQPGEDYGQAEECHTHITQHTFKSVKFEVFYDEMASPLSQWKAFAAGIGTKSAMERETVIDLMHKAIICRP